MVLLPSPYLGLASLDGRVDLIFHVIPDLFRARWSPFPCKWTLLTFASALVAIASSASAGPQGRKARSRSV